MSKKEEDKAQKERNDLSKKVVGLSFEEFRKQYPTVAYRVMEANGVGFVSTADFRTDRLNLHLEGVEELEPHKYVYNGQEYSVKKFGSYARGIIKKCGWG